MAINKLPVLDKGYISLFSTSMDDKKIIEIRNSIFRGKPDRTLLSLPKLHLMIKSPVFVQLVLLQQKITCINQKGVVPEAYVPSVNDIGAKDLETSELIQHDIEQTTEALLLNPKSYQMDACDTFIAQVITPISVYNTYLASGELIDWISLCSREDLPAPIKAYCKTISDIIKAEWPSLREFIDVKAERGRR